MSSIGTESSTDAINSKTTPKSRPNSTSIDTGVTADTLSSISSNTGSLSSTPMSKATVMSVNPGFNSTTPNTGNFSSPPLDKTTVSSGSSSRAVTTSVVGSLGSTVGSPSNTTLTTGSAGDTTISTATEHPSTSVGTIATAATPSPCREGYNRTIIFIKAETTPGQKVFFCGGIDGNHVTGRCLSNADARNPCVIAIEHSETSNDPAYVKWSTGDNFLDWYGAESSQGRYTGISASGTPSVITTNRSHSPYWHVLNTFGENYWMADLCMNCNDTVSGWFEVKSVINGSWGNDISQISPCGGSAPLSERSPVFTGTNHIGRCGKVNAFIRNDASCIINDVDLHNQPTPSAMQPTTAYDTTVGPGENSTTNEISTTTRAPSCPTGLTRTVIMIQSSTSFGQNVFVRGGNEHTRVTGRCQSSVSANNPCCVRITHRDPPTNSPYAAWAVGDNYLDWYGPERGQGQYQDKNADGSPTMWTTNDNRSASWNALNTFGANYWLADMCMNCSQTVSGWFEFKSVITGSQWEGNINQIGTCNGSADVTKRTAPFTSGNHIGYCGRLNVFIRDSGVCTINDLYEDFAGT
ncbi:mucin-12-like [Gigantopelta aegis]|uniref:mucin-12-like n=1 Tax=Gigantopelta aegis TaxID=1735272 RepID=UPI001B88A980|nr:mucin-12-like [Gigantopelta aegis]